MSIKKNEIRPKEIDQAYDEILKEEIDQYFIDSKSCQLKEEIANYINCPACSADPQYSNQFKKNGFNLVRCDRCEMVYLTPRPKSKALANFFENSQALSLYSEMVEGSKLARTSHIFTPLVDSLANILQSPGRGLEVGCGSGLLLELMKSSYPQWRFYGLEPNIRAVEICKSKNLEVFNGVLETFEAPEKYDLVIMWAVLDHFYSPIDALTKAYDLLAEGGHIVIGNMNIEGFDSMIFGDNNPTFDPPERMNFFGKRSIKVLLERCGFSSVVINTTGKLDVDIVRDYWQSGGKQGANPFLEKIIMSEDIGVRTEFQSFLQKSNLSGHMTVSAKK